MATSRGRNSAKGAYHSRSQWVCGTSVTRSTGRVSHGPRGGC
ncbi:MAG: hypothetical protein KatS3mg014_0252 [Actinomycetota bacterium]|nr:MAG: hypothetical protein KatS3mg014_0252 [Actinomycetota bacterium]